MTLPVSLIRPISNISPLVKEDALHFLVWCHVNLPIPVSSSTTIVILFNSFYFRDCIISILSLHHNMYLSKPLSFLALASPAAAFIRGINFGAQLPSGACRTQKDYDREFSVIKSSAPSFDTVRLFASSDCLQLASAIPAALKHGIKILAGVWTQDEAHYGTEKNALVGALAAYPNWQDWLVAISVGSEDLYRNEAPPGRIAEKISEVRGMVRAQGVTALVGHVDTWTAW
jgi:exo-beta-1,3-glucanase (GH17 family)